MNVFGLPFVFSEETLAVSTPGQKVVGIADPAPVDERRPRLLDAFGPALAGLAPNRASEVFAHRGCPPPCPPDSTPEPPQSGQGSTMMRGPLQAQSEPIVVHGARSEYEPSPSQREQRSSSRLLSPVTRPSPDRQPRPRSTRRSRPISLVVDVLPAAAALADEHGRCRAERDPVVRASAQASVALADRVSLHAVPTLGVVIVPPPGKRPERHEHADRRLRQRS
jgi:hypothetical protein